MSADIADLLRRREILAKTVQRLEGQREQAQVNLAQVEQECRDAKINPEDLPKMIEALSSRVEKERRDLEVAITQAEAEIQALLNRVR